MKVSFFENQNLIGVITEGPERVLFSDDFPEVMKEKFELDGIEYRRYEDGALVSKEILFPRDGKRFLEALPTIFHNMYLTAKLEQ
jgi:hypothetical protein